jgi:hypothetical protein
MRHAGAGQGNKVVDEPQQMSIAEFSCIIAIRTGAVDTALSAHQRACDAELHVGVDIMVVRHVHLMMTHLELSEASDTGEATTWLEPVSDADYRKAPTRPE